MESEIRAKIGKLPRVKLANLPTPLEEMHRLSERLGGPKLWVKRDDLTGLVFGGNKVRKLEFEMADALNKGADVVVAGGVVQSNHAFATVSAARKLGMKAVLLLRGEKPERYDGNLLLDRIFGAEIKIFKAKWEETVEVTRKTVERLKNQGHNPYVVPFSSPPGSIGCVNALIELLAQARSMNLKVDYLIHGAGSGGTQAGLIVAEKALAAGVNVIGIATETNGEWLLNETERIANACAKLLDLDLLVRKEDITILYDYVGDGYGILTKELRNTIKLIAETEGMLLDPVYTAKAMTGLIELVKQGKFKKYENVVFLHTGGTPSIFAFTKSFQPHEVCGL